MLLYIIKFNKNEHTKNIKPLAIRSRVSTDKSLYPITSLKKLIISKMRKND